MTTPTTEPKPKCKATVAGVGGAIYRCAADPGHNGAHTWRFVTVPRVREKVTGGVTVRESWGYDGTTHACAALHRQVTVCGVPTGGKVNGEVVVTTVFRSSITCPACLARIARDKLDLPGDKC